MSNPKPVLLTTLNARYIHAAFGLRYLKANLGRYQEYCEIEEFTLETRAADAAEKLLSYSPRIIGIGVYIWNVRPVQELVATLKAVAPHVMIVVGGPEVSHELETQPWLAQVDHVITGWGEVTFRELVETTLEGGDNHEKVLTGVQPPLRDLHMPYHLYSQQDIENRVLYVEASRGCPFKCEFCLSALDKTAWPFDIDVFLDEMQRLYDRGARHFKFVDRTFNLKVKHSVRILEFFLARLDPNLFLHFELIPDHLPTALKSLIAQFPSNTLQFEIGIQTFNPEVQSRIGRRQDNQLAVDNIRWILQHTQAHVHTDLIFGLPGESLDSFANSFDQLATLAPHEIQVGILKRLKGSPITRHTTEYDMVFNPAPPFNILASSEFDFSTQQRLVRFARFWDLIGNSGRFRATLPLLLADQPFKRFMRLSEKLFEVSAQTHKISLSRLIDLIHACASPELVDANALRATLTTDFERSGLKSRPKSLRVSQHSGETTAPNSRHAARQARHQRA